MSGRESKKVKVDDLNFSITSAVKDGNLDSVKNLVSSQGLSYCKDSHKGYMLLCNAIESGHVEIAKFLLRKGAEVDCKTYVGWPLYFAMRLKPVDPDLIRLLIEKNAPVHVQTDSKETALHFAAKKGYADIVQILLDNNASVSAENKEGATPLILAGKYGHEDVVKVFFNHARTNVKDVEDSIPSTYSVSERDSSYLLHTAVKGGYKDFVKLFLSLGFGANAKDKYGKTPLFYSLNCDVEGDCVEILRFLFASGADVSEAPELLHAAVTVRFIDVCRILIKNAADVNASNTCGDTPLHLAVLKRGKVLGSELENREIIEEAVRDEIIKLLLNNNADVSIKTQTGVTAFHLAVMHGRKNAVCTFLSSGVDVDLCDENYSTPLHYAAKIGSTEIIRILCENGANVDARQRDGSTPLHLAAQREDAGVEILLNSGSDINSEKLDGDTALDIAISSAESDHDEIYFNHPYMVYYHDDYDDSDEFCLEDYDTVTTLKQHVTKLMAAGFFVSERNLSLIHKMDFEDSFSKEECEEEVSQMKHFQIRDEKLDLHYTLYDFLLNGRNLTYPESRAIVQILRSCTFKKFPIYKGLLKNIFENNKARLECLNSGQKSLDLLVETSFQLTGSYLVLPIELLGKIVSYLQTSELKSLTSCGETLERQLSQ